MEHSGDTCDGCCHRNGVIQNWQLECRGLEAKVQRLKARREEIRDVVRQIETGYVDNLELQKILHRLVFN